MKSSVKPKPQPRHQRSETLQTPMVMSKALRDRLTRLRGHLRRRRTA